MKDLPRFHALGVPVCAATFEDALCLLETAPARGDRLRVHFATAHTLVTANELPEFRSLLSASEAHVFPDGMPLVWVGRRAKKHVERVCGPDVMLALMGRTATTGARHYFYGGAPGVAEEMAARFRALFPGLQVVGCVSPPFRPLTPAEDATYVREINESRADYVWVGLGCPKQEFWAAEHRPLLDAAVILAVGAAFDFYSGRVGRAPRWMQRTGLEWSFRLFADPRRLWRRYTVTNLKFAWLLLTTQFRR